MMWWITATLSGIYWKSSINTIWNKVLDDILEIKDGDVARQPCFGGLKGPSWLPVARGWHSALGQPVDFPFRSVLTWEMYIRILGFIFPEIQVFLIGGMDGMLTQTSRKPNTNPQKPQTKPKKPLMYGGVRSYTMNVCTVLLHSSQSGLQHL